MVASFFARAGRIFLLASLVFACLLLRAQPLSAEPFNKNLSAEDRARLEKGEIVIRNIGKAKNISLNPINANAKRAIDSITRLNPVYLAEVILVKPYAGNENAVSQMRDVLVDVPAYKGIPYYSESGKSYHELYSSATVQSKTSTKTGLRILANLVMNPFTPISADITIDTDTAPTLFYQMENTNKLKIDNMTVVSENGMQSIIIVFRSENSLVFYGIGGVKAPSIFFLKARVETSFMNRIKTFCLYVYDRLQ